ncbi:MAG: hypothetical protein AABX38_04820 [Candidatus Micrarchaeota archaeon]
MGYQESKIDKKSEIIKLIEPTKEKKILINVPPEKDLGRMYTKLTGKIDELEKRIERLENLKDPKKLIPKK